MLHIKHKQRGESLVSLLIAIFIISLVFITLFTSFNAMLAFAERNRMRTNAIMLANEHIEIIRALPFDSIGTIAGLPSGNIPQNEVIIFDGHSYNRRTFVQYVDDPADGTGAADTLTADYKRAKVEMSYDYRGVTQSFSIVASIAPKSQESLAGAGVLRINVTDAINDPIWMASVHVVNNIVATSVDITTFTNASGTVSFPGAWAGGGYEVYIDKSGYSNAQTYSATTSNPNPSPSPYNVPENGTMEVYFKIDLFSTINVRTRAWPTRSRLTDSFDDASLLSINTNTQVISGGLTLSGLPGSYSLSGNSKSIVITPASIASWLLFSFDDAMPTNTSAAYQIEYDTGGGIFALVPDSDLPNNSVGFTTSPVGLYNLSTSTYNSLRINTNLTTTDLNVTPEVYNYTLSYAELDSVIPNVNFDLQGAKTIGAGIYKYDKSHQTSATGLWQSGNMEWDIYTLNVAGYDVAEACPILQPLVLEPSTEFNQLLTLSTLSANNLKIRILNPLSGNVEHAEVRIVGGSDDITLSTGPCGVAYYPSLSPATYDVSVIADGFKYATSTVIVNGATSDSITLSL